MSQLHTRFCSQQNNSFAAHFLNELCKELNFFHLTWSEGQFPKAKTFCLIQKLFAWKSDPKGAGSKWSNFSFCTFSALAVLSDLLPQVKTYMKIKFSSLNINYRCTDWTDLMVHWCPKELVSSLMPPSLLSLPWLWCWADPALNQTASDGLSRCIFPAQGLASTRTCSRLETGWHGWKHKEGITGRCSQEEEIGLAAAFIIHPRSSGCQGVTRIRQKTVIRAGTYLLAKWYCTATGSETSLCSLASLRNGERNCISYYQSYLPSCC